MKSLFQVSKNLLRRAHYWFLKTTTRIPKPHLGLIPESRVAEQSMEKLAVVFHAYHMHQVPKILEQLKEFRDSIEIGLDIHITCASDSQKQISNHLSTLHLEATITPVTNLGRDVLPFLLSCKRQNLEDYALVLKIHTKADRILRNGVLLNAASISEYLKPELVPALVKKSIQGLNFVAAPARYIANGSSWGANVKNTVRLAKSLGISELPSRLNFIAGTMFWASSALIQRLSLLEVDPEQFEPEPISGDGTVAHAYERLFGLIASSNGIGVVSLEEISSQGEK